MPGHLSGEIAFVMICAKKKKQSELQHPGQRPSLNEHSNSCAGQISAQASVFLSLHLITVISVEVHVF